jgi:excinuclease UvrABC nuclease subunit
VAQRKKKRGSIKKSKLDEIDGIGEVIKKRLLSKYKSIKMIRTVNEDDLMTVKGINAKIAMQIKEKL